MQGTVRGFIASAAFAAVLAGCAAPAPVQSPPLSFAQRGTIALDAATIEIVDQYRPTQARPHVEHRVPTPPALAVRQWAAERLRAVGRTGSVQVIIRDAGIVESDLPRAEGVKSLFTNQQAQRYDGRIEVLITGQNPAARFSGSAQAEVIRSTTVAEDVSLAGREATWTTLVHQMMDDLDQRLTQGIRDGLGPMLRR